MKNVKNICFIILITIGMGCKKPYNPPAISNNGSYLVVEGVINSGADSTTLTLSKTDNISSATTANPVLNAAVSVISDQNVSYPLTETTNGNYVSPGLNLASTHTYRLFIKTSDNQQYQSDLVPVTITPPIDSIGFSILNGTQTGVQIYVNTHDPNNNTHYYRWDYSESWQFSSKYISNYVSNGTALVPRQPAQNVSVCYTSDVSSNIVLGSSAKLTQDVIYQEPVLFIPNTSEKFEDRYSILLNEYALTSDAYNFWVNLKNNTEQLGSIFDAQPSQVPGNIHCITNPSQPVIGYISVCSVSSKRIFINSSQLPAWSPVYPYQCDLDTTGNGSGVYVPDLINDTKVYRALDGFPPLNPVRFTFTSVECGDCTIRGSTTPPAYWK